MAKLAPGPRNITRVVIAGLLAWVLAFQGLAAGVAPHLLFSDAGASSAGFDVCAADSTDEKQPPGRHDPCACCILCPSGQSGGLAALAATPPTGADLALPTSDAGISRHALATTTAPPPGWTSSWSQRAPPHRA